MNVQLVVDRMEGEAAVCLDLEKKMYRLPLSQLPPGLKEGDWLMQTPEGWCIDNEETRRRREKNRDLFRHLLKKDRLP